MRNPERRNGDGRAEKHSSKDQTNYANGDPESRTRRGWLGRWRRGGYRSTRFDGQVMCQRCSRNIRAFGQRQKTIPFARNGLDIERLVCGIAENLAKLVHRCVDVGVVVDMRVGGPEALPQFLAG